MATMTKSSRLKDASAARANSAAAARAEREARKAAADARKRERDAAKREREREKHNERAARKREALARKEEREAERAAKRNARVKRLADKDANNHGIVGKIRTRSVGAIVDSRIGSGVKAAIREQEGVIVSELKSGNVQGAIDAVFSAVDANISSVVSSALERVRLPALRDGAGVNEQYAIDLVMNATGYDLADSDSLDTAGALLFAAALMERFGVSREFANKFMDADPVDVVANMALGGDFRPYNATHPQFKEWCAVRASVTDAGLNWMQYKRARMIVASREYRARQDWTK